MLTITEFCDRHNACGPGRDWALANCATLDDVWRTAKPEWLVWVATRPGVLDERTLRSFAVHCARSVEHLSTDGQSLAALDVAERFANGEATQEEMAAAAFAAWAVWAALATWESALAARAAWAACELAAMATWAAWESAAAAAWVAAWAARDAQAEWLRSNATPNFT